MQVSGGTIPEFRGSIRSGKVDTLRLGGFVSVSRALMRNCYVAPKVLRASRGETSGTLILVT